MKYSVCIKGILPAMDEYLYASKAHSSASERLRRDALAKCMSQIRLQLPDIRITKSVRLHFKWVEPNYRRGLADISSFGHSIVEEALMQCSVLTRESVVIGYTDIISVDAFEPKIVIEIEEID